MDMTGTKQVVSRPTPLHFPTIMELVTRENLQIQWDGKNLSPYVRYKEQDEEHIIEFLDVASFYNQMKIASSHGIPSIGIWNIGSEYPSIWKLFSNESSEFVGIRNYSERGIR